MPKLFDEKYFNGEAWLKYMQAIPNEKLNKLRSSRAIVRDARLRETFKNSPQTGTSYGIVPYFGTLSGEPQNYNGVEDITPGRTNSYKQGIFTYGRMMGWTEADFSYDITGGADFEANVRRQIMEYWNAVDQDVLLAILEGVFALTGTGSDTFKKTHTFDVTAEGEGVVTPTTLNSAIQAASGDHKNLFSLAVMHSAVATNLENLNLLEHLKHTDANGIQRDLELATWNGRMVLIDDFVPSEPTQNAAGEDVTNYTTYILGNGAISFEEIGAKVPYEMDRDPYTRGGETTLISRRRNAIAVSGISYTQKNQATDSPTNDELKDGANWELVQDSKGKTISQKLIPITRIISMG